MRFPFLRAGKDKASVRKPLVKVRGAKDVAAKPAAPVFAPTAPAFTAPPRFEETSDFDLRAVGRALVRKRRWVIGPSLAALVISLVAVNLVTPRYKSEARILIDGRENVFLRPNGERAEERSALDPEAVTSQVQLLLSRDLARDVIRKNKLAELPEFDPVLQGMAPIKTVLALFGIGRDPFSLTPEERVLDAYNDRLTAYAVDKSRVIVIEFQSRDPDLAARVANSISDGYLTMQQGARQGQAKAAGQWLSGEIDDLRKKVGDAEARVEDFRSKSSLFVGTNNTSLSNQQMGEINSQLNNARALKSDAESKSRLIREMLNSGKPIEASETLNSDSMRKLSEQRVTLRAQLAEQSSTLLDNHPRIKELKAQLGDLDRQLRDEAAKLSRSLENDAKIAGGRVDGLSNSLDQMKKQATSTNGQDVQLRAMEREAKAQRDLLETYLAKYREATTRENIDMVPSDGRIISRAIVSNTPAYPKKLPIVLIATLGTLLLTSGLVATGELLRVTAPRAPMPTRTEAQVMIAAAAPSVVPAMAATPVMMPVAEDGPYVAPEMAPRASREVIALCQDLRAAGEGARKISVIGTGDTEAISTTAIELARQLALTAKVVLVDLSASPAALSAASVDASAPGLSEMILGQASFGQIITRDRMSALHLVASGRPNADRAVLQSPRLAMALDALLRVYDHVVLDAGTANEVPPALLTTQAKAVLVPDASMTADAIDVMGGQLKAIGFVEILVLKRNAGMPADDQRVVAA